MLLSLVIKNTTQIVFPERQLFGFIEPIFAECRNNIKFNNRPQPFISASKNLSAAEIAVADLESFSQSFILQYFFVQLLDMADQFIEGFAIKTFLIFYKSFGAETRFHFKETESASEGIIDHCKTAVGCIHHSNDIQIIRYKELHSAVG